MIKFENAGFTFHEDLDSQIICRTSSSKAERGIGFVEGGTKSKCSWEHVASSSFACAPNALMRQIIPLPARPPSSGMEK
jgi:hypothetical protein